MGRKHTIQYLDSDTRGRIDAFLAAEGRTVDEFVQFLRDDIGLDISRSAAHRYQRQFEQVAWRMRESREMAEALCKELGPAAEQGKTGELIREIMQNLVFDHLLSRQQDGQGGGPEDLMLLARTIKDLAGAQKLDTDRVAKIREAERKKVAKETAQRVEAAAARQGLTPETKAAFMAEVFGTDAA